MYNVIKNLISISKASTLNRVISGVFLGILFFMAMAFVLVIAIKWTEFFAYAVMYCAFASISFQAIIFLLPIISDDKIIQQTLRIGSTVSVLIVLVTIILGSMRISPFYEIIRLKLF